MIKCFNCKSSFDTVEDYISQSKFDEKLGCWIHDCKWNYLPDMPPKTLVQIEGDITEERLKEWNKSLKMLLSKEATRDTSQDQLSRLSDLRDE